MFAKPKTRALVALGTLFMLLFVSACAGAATPTHAPAATKAPEYAPQAPAGNEAPAATQAPASNSYLPQPTYVSPNYNPSISSNPNAPQGSNPAYDMFFQNYGVNPSIDTEDDHLSTFALDVDTGSYTVMRNYLRDGNLPPPDSVRVEEYVNYFNQHYPNPPQHQAFGITMDGAPSRFTQTDRYQMLRIGIQGYQVPPDQRKDLSLTFVIDISGSMGMENRLELVKRSLELLVEQLRPTDTVGIVVFGTDARVLLDPTPGSDQETILSAIHQLAPEGATNTEEGLRMGYDMALHTYNPEAINRVILCSDGVANVGNTDPNVILDEVRGHIEEGVTLTTIGFGMGNYNDTLMEQLADKGNGFYAYVDDISAAKKLFIDKLTGTLQTIALNAKVQVDFNPEVVKNYRLVGFENRAVADNQFRNNSVDAGEVGAGHSVTALYEVKLYRESYGKIATVYLRWEDPDTHAVTEISKDFNAENLAPEFSEADPYFQRAVVVAEYAEILKHSYWAQNSSLEAVYQEASRIYESMPRERDMEEFVDLVRTALQYSE